VSIAPPSDIILDVAQAADPQRLQAATSKLNGMAAAAGGAASMARPDDFAAILAGAAGTRPAGSKSLVGSTLFPMAAGTLPPESSPYRKFEAVLLQTFIQEMLPKDEHLFGDAASADICRSMLAEQLATQLSKTGRIGIARMIEKAHGPTGAMTQAAPQAALAAPQAALAAPHAALAAPQAALAAPHSEAVPSGPAAVDPVPLDAAGLG
jgi:flagellar protein FlgJ